MFPKIGRSLLGVVKTEAKVARDMSSESSQAVLSFTEVLRQTPISRTLTTSHADQWAKSKMGIMTRDRI